MRKQSAKRPDPTPYVRAGLIMPPFLTSSKKAVADLRRALKLMAYERDRACFGCGISFDSFDWSDAERGPIAHLHEGIFSRGRAAGWPGHWKILIFCEVNCLLLCSDCNLGRSGKSAPSPMAVWDRHVEMYGARVMVDWARSLPFRLLPMFVDITERGLDEKV